MPALLVATPGTLVLRSALLRTGPRLPDLCNFRPLDAVISPVRKGAYCPLLLRDLPSMTRLGEIAPWRGLYIEGHATVAADTAAFENARLQL